MGAQSARIKQPVTKPMHAGMLAEGYIDDIHADTIVENQASRENAIAQIWTFTVQMALNPSKGEYCAAAKRGKLTVSGISIEKMATLKLLEDYVGDAKRPPGWPGASRVRSFSCRRSNMYVVLGQENRIDLLTTSATPSPLLGPGTACRQPFGLRYRVAEAITAKRDRNFDEE